MKRRSIIHLVESEEDNEGIISPCKKEGKNNGGEERKKSLNNIHGKKEKSKKKRKYFTRTFNYLTLKGLYLLHLILFSKMNS